MSAVRAHDAVPAEPQRLMDAAALDRTLTRLAHEVLERYREPGVPVLVGIRDGGVPVARALATVMAALGGRRPAVLTLDVTAWRDDRPRPDRAAEGALATLDGEVGAPVLGAAVLLVDDVLHTGRTLRAALEGLAAHGRPASVEALVLVDRGRRELPLRATFVGRNLPVAAGDWVDVALDAGSAPGAWLVRRA